jgi:hypothetical protein
MYKALLIHEVLPGKLSEMKEWFKQADERYKKNDPNWKPFKRYITVFGSVHQVVIEIETEKVWVEPPVFAEGNPTDASADFMKLIVPGRTETRLLKELDLSS